MRRILVIDDNPVETSRLHAEITKLDYEISCVCSGAEAIVTAREFNPEMILLNPILPDMNGYDLCQKLREQNETAHIPILLIASSNITSGKEESITLANADSIALTHDIKTLQEKMETCLRVKTYLDKRIYSKNDPVAYSRDPQFLTITDPVTGLLNKKYLHNVLLQEFLRSKRYSTFFSIIMMDVDCFKKVNDAFGHDIGDQILYELSVVIRSQMRGVDIISRYGGDVFTALLPQSSCAMAMIVAKRILEAVRIHIFPRLKKDARWEGTPLTLSMGICGLPNAEIHQAIQVISGADLAILRAKKMGKNRIEVATEKDINLIPPNL